MKLYYALPIVALLVGVGLVASGCARESIDAPQVNNGDAQRGERVLRRYECGVCHVIPGVRHARGQVGPSLAAYRHNVYVAGKLPNTPEHLIKWIMDAPALAPQTAMPAMGVSAGDATDVAAYLYALK
jgi:cytochrome c